MAGTVVWKRSTKLPLRWQRRINGVFSSGDLHAGGAVSLPVPTQTTTSFRTGHGSPGENDEVIPTSRDQAFRTWFLENKVLSNPLDCGHPFSSTRQVLEVRTSPVTIKNASGTRWYCFPPWEDYRFHNGGTSTFPVVQLPDLNWYGTQAIRKTIPTNSVADLSNLLGELYREGLPRLIGAALLKSQALFFRSLGSEFLNVEFGWKPFLSDLHDLLNAVVNSGELIKQFERDSGRVVRRRYEFPIEKRTLLDVTKTGALASPDNSSNFTSLFPFGLGGQLRETVIETRRVWFSGAYSYYLSDGRSLLSKVERFMQKAKFLLGIRITPEVLWNLAPWTWLSDWVGNLGDVLHNVESLSSDGLVLRYGYLMCTITSERTCTLTGVRLSSGTLPPVVVSYLTIRKERIAATPYGFGLNPNGLTDRQKAILAALGSQAGDR